MIFSKIDKNPYEDLLSSDHHVSNPSWHTGPSGNTFISKVSLSQSRLISTKFRKFPLVSPFTQIEFLDLEGH